MDLSSIDFQSLLGAGEAGPNKMSMGVSSGISSIEEIIELLRQGKKVPDDIDPDLVKELQERTLGNEPLAKLVDQGIKQGLMVGLPGIGHAISAIDEVGGALAMKDEYGVAKSDLTAGVSSLLNPVGRISDTVGDISKDGFQFDDLLNMVPVFGGIHNRKEAAKERDRTRKKQSSRDHLENFQEKQNYFNDLYQGLADGGKVEGKGTSKSDSIKTKLESGSFVVPAENSSLAFQIGKELLGWKDNQKAKKGSGSKVALSDGEVVFKPEEVQKLSEFGINIEALAPNADGSKKMKKGGYKGYNQGGETGDDDWKKMAKNLIWKNEGDRNEAYNDNNHISVGPGLLLYYRDPKTKKLKPTGSGTKILRKLGYSNEDIQSIAKGDKKLKDGDSEKIMQEYFDNVLMPDLSRLYGEKWNQMNSESKAIAADLMYNEGGYKMSQDKWKPVVENLADNKPQEALNTISDSEDLASWRSYTKSRPKRIAKELSLEYNEPKEEKKPEGVGREFDRTPDYIGETIDKVGETVDEVKDWFGSLFEDPFDSSNPPKDFQAPEGTVWDEKTRSYVPNTLGDIDLSENEAESIVEEEIPLPEGDEILEDIQISEKEIEEIFGNVQMLPADLKSEIPDLTKRNITPELKMPNPQKETSTEVPVTQAGEKSGSSDWLNMGNILSAGQIVYGMKGLMDMGDRPEDSMGSGFTNWVQGLRNEEADGFTAEEWSTYTNEIDNIRKNDLRSIQSLVGGDAGLAMASILETGVRSNDAMAKLASEDAAIRRDEENRIRNQRANAELAYERRRSELADKEMQAFDQNQQNFANILNAGVHNLIGNNDPLYRHYITKQQGNV